MRINAVQLEAPYAGIVHIRFYVSKVYLQQGSIFSCIAKKKFPI
jgi:hypothetical protein